MAGAHAPRERSSEWQKDWVQVFTNSYPVIRDKTLGGGVSPSCQMPEHW